MLWQRNEAWVGSQIDDRLVMVDIDSGQYVALNRTADAIWQMLEEPRTEQDVVSLLRERFDIDEKACAHSVAATLEWMRTLKLASTR